jgi:hypothetical protein
LRSVRQAAEEGCDNWIFGSTKGEVPHRGCHDQDAIEIIDYAPVPNACWADEVLIAVVISAGSSLAEIRAVPQPQTGPVSGRISDMTMASSVSAPQGIAAIRQNPCVESAAIPGVA